MEICGKGWFLHPILRERATENSKLCRCRHSVNELLRCVYNEHTDSISVSVSGSVSDIININDTPLYLELNVTLRRTLISMDTSAHYRRTTCILQRNLFLSDSYIHNDMLISDTAIFFLGETNKLLGVNDNWV